MDRFYGQYNQSIYKSSSYTGNKYQSSSMNFQESRGNNYRNYESGYQYGNPSYSQNQNSYPYKPQSDSIYNSQGNHTPYASRVFANNYIDKNVIRGQNYQDYKKYGSDAKDISYQRYQHSNINLTPSTLTNGKYKDENYSFKEKKDYSQVYKYHGSTNIHKYDFRNIDREQIYNDERNYKNTIQEAPQEQTLANKMGDKFHTDYKKHQKTESILRNTDKYSVSNYLKQKNEPTNYSILSPSQKSIQIYNQLPSKSPNLDQKFQSQNPNLISQKKEVTESNLIKKVPYDESKIIKIGDQLYNSLKQNKIVSEISDNEAQIQNSNQIKISRNYTESKSQNQMHLTDIAIQKIEVPLLNLNFGNQQSNKIKQNLQIQKSDQDLNKQIQEIIKFPSEIFSNSQNQDQIINRHYMQQVQANTPKKENFDLIQSVKKENYINRSEIIKEHIKQMRNNSNIQFHPQPNELNENSLDDDSQNEEEAVGPLPPSNNYEFLNLRTPDRRANKDTIQEQQTCWKKPKRGKGKLQDQNIIEAEIDSGCNIKQKNLQNQILIDRDSSPEKMIQQIPQEYFQSPEKKQGNQFIDYNPESPDNTLSKVGRIIQNINSNKKNQSIAINLQNQINQQMTQLKQNIVSLKKTVEEQNELHLHVQRVHDLSISPTRGKGNTEQITQRAGISKSRGETIDQSQIKFEEIKKIIVPEVYMRCVTWTRDSNGLFDYESKNISKKNIKTQTGGRVIRIGEEVQLVAKSQDISLLKPKLNDDIIHEENCECHLQYLPQKMLVLERELKEPGIYDDFIVRNDTLNQEKTKNQDINEAISDGQAQNMFIVVRNTKSTQNNEDYKLCKGDIIKLGRIKFKVKELQFLRKFSNKEIKNKKIYTNDDSHSSEDEDQVFTQIKIDQIKTQNTFLSKYVNGAENKQNEDQSQACLCKFCWMSDSKIENPLLSACQCDGSMRYIHFNCLKQWIKEKMVRKEIDVTGSGKIFTYTWKQFECEICKHAYPLTFKSITHSNQQLTYGIVHEIIKPDIPRSSENFRIIDEDSSYMIIQSLPFEKSSGRVVHMIVPDLNIEKNENQECENKLFKMGRGHESQVRICDISVSRCHTLIKYNPINGYFMLEDNLSKFGTLVIPKQKKIRLQANTTKAIQIGRSVISFTVKEIEKEIISLGSNRKQIQ